jgi:hypothetical protein
MLVLEKLVNKEMVFCILERRILIESMERMKRVDDLIEKIINQMGKGKEKEKDLNRIIRNLSIKKENDLFKLSLH